jgi:hypothetical protein
MTKASASQSAYNQTKSEKESIWSRFDRITSQQIGSTATKTGGKSSKIPYHL